jgi:4-hydroxyphenylpyruvate dioxygenase
MTVLHTNELGIATLSLGHHSLHSLTSRIHAAAHAGYHVIDLFDEDWAAYLTDENGLDSTDPWEPSEAKLAAARQLRDLIASLGMRIACSQPLREIEGHLDAAGREAAMSRVAARFPFLRAFGADLVFMCSNTRARMPGVTCTTDYQTTARDLAALGDVAREFSARDGGPLLKIGYEPLSWGGRNTWASAWEVVRAADRDNVGLILDSFNLLAVEFADPFSTAGEGGMLYPTREQAVRVLRASLAALVATVPPEKIFFVQVADAECVDPSVLVLPTDPSLPRILPWSRLHRLFPMEQDRGGYLPADMVLAAILETGYKGPLSIEVFSHFLHEKGHQVPVQLAKRGINGLRNLITQAETIPKFSDSKARL